MRSQAVLSRQAADAAEAEADGEVAQEDLGHLPSYARPTR